MTSKSYQSHLLSSSLYNHIFILFIFLSIFFKLSQSLCEIKSLEKVAILEIAESFGDRFDQKTIPEELPIRGDESEISLQLISETHKYFDLKGKRLILNKPIDRDKDGLTSIYSQISCTEKKTGVKKSIPVLVKVIDINDNPPVFQKESYSVNVSETTPVGSIIFRELNAIDIDSGNNGLVEYHIVPINGDPRDGYNYFEIKMPHQGHISVRKPLDYEHISQMYLQVVASDTGSSNSDRLSSNTTITINILDGDDQNPWFEYRNCSRIKGRCTKPEYKGAILSDSPGGVITILPEPIYARDGDTLNTSIRYSFVNGTPPAHIYDQYLQIDETTGLVRQVKRVDRSVAKLFTLTVKAEQVDNPVRYTLAKLVIQVLAVDRSPPVIHASSTTGYIPENSPTGTIVPQDVEGKIPLKLTVNDPDIGKDDAPAIYEFEVTTHAFRVNGDGYLIINDDHLDRDPPNPTIYKFQVIARQVGSVIGKGASRPLSLNIHLLDVNDNPPKLPNFSPVQIQAGEGARRVYKIEAKDLDESDQGKLIYSIYHVSNNGRERFRIDPDSGQIEAIGKLTAGEQYSLTIQVTDTSNKFAQGILDVFVIRGPNTAGPSFPKERYEIEISEGISVYSAVITLKATDPENDPIRYSILDGNTNSDFYIDSSTGSISVARQLDREEVSSYNLIIKAEDKDGLSGTTILSISVTDINDQNPRFARPTFTFRVEEGSADAFVGKVVATDADIGENAVIIYSIGSSGASNSMDTDKNPLFRINPSTGEIFTRTELDYEKVKEHVFVVTAKDRAPDARLSTVTVTVQVIDLQDELPYFSQPVYNVMIQENHSNRQLVQVVAIDPDTVPSVTYMIREGDETLFQIDSSTGVIKVVRSLDFERRDSYSLTIGTVENNSDDPRATCRVLITVLDQNDVSPVFSAIPAPLRLPDSVSLGTILTTVKATDGDGTAPGNIVRYEIAGRDKAPQYFIIDPSTGVISVKDDLRKDPESEYRIDVIARDGGSPSLSATATLTVFVDHIATPAPDSGLGFPDSRYTVEVEENAPPNSIIKTLAIMNKPRIHFPMDCEIMSGNEEDKFLITENVNRDCEIRIKDQPLDYEKKSRYMLTVRINTIGGLKGVSRLMTQVIINVIDVNDNKPTFHVPQRYAHLTHNRYITAISADAPSESQIIQLKATDADSVSNGAITFELLPASDPQGRFKIDPSTGILRSSRPVEDIPPSHLPLRIAAIARDNPQLQSSSSSETCEVVINLIEDRHRVIFVLRETSTERVQEMRDQFLQIIQERTGLIPGWEKAESLKIQRNHTIESDVTGTDVWLYLVEPSSLKILSNDEPKVLNTLFEPKSQKSLLKAIVHVLSVRAVSIRRPYITMQHHSTANVIPVPIGGDVNDLGIALIILAAIIAVVGFAGIVYQCGSVGKTNSSSGSIQKPQLPNCKRVAMSRARPRIIEPVYTDSHHHHSSSKEYETQVLQMDLKIDDDNLINYRCDTRDHGKQSLRGLTVRNGEHSTISYIPRSRAYNNNSPSNPSTATTTSNNERLRPDSSGSSSGNSDLKSNIKNPLYGDFS
ncbi:cadherin 99C isoform X2 [Brevipalpus obovatus]